MDPMLEQFCRVHSPENLRFDWFRQFQSYLSSVIHPKLVNIEALELENEKLREELASLRQQQPEPVVKRKRGRPRKVQPEDVAVGA